MIQLQHEQDQHEQQTEQVHQDQVLSDKTQLGDGIRSLRSTLLRSRNWTAPALERLAPLVCDYVNELRAFDANPSAGSAEDYPFLKTYLSHPTRLALAFGDASIHGFVLLFEDPDPGDGEITMEIREFFVHPQYRRSGAGRGAVKALLRSWPGSWQLAVLERNTSALKFWQSVLSDRSASISKERGHYYFSIDRPQAR